MTLALRDTLENDLAAILALNQSEVPHVGSLKDAELAAHFERADYFRQVSEAGQLAGFLIGYGPGSDYASSNYRWFCDRYEQFMYVDRIAVSPNFRRSGVGSMLYRDLESNSRAPILTCEVNLQPENPGSMHYHERLGFRQVGTLASDDGSKVVAMLLKDLA